MEGLTEIIMNVWEEGFLGIGITEIIVSDSDGNSLNFSFYQRVLLYLLKKICGILT